MASVIQQYSKEGRKPTFDDFRDRAKDAQFLDSLQSGVNIWIEEIQKFLEGEGMVGIVCRKLKPKDGKVYKTSAFRVTCSPDSIELFYDENCWPSGVELRDWVYK